MDDIRIPNQATYSPVAFSDVVMAAPLAARLLLGTSLPGRVLQAAAFGAYAGSAVRDWIERRGVRKIDFAAHFGAGAGRLRSMSPAEREADIRGVVEGLNAGYVPMDVPRRELAVRIDRVLTDYIAGITGQRVETSAEVRSFTLAGLLFPFALGTADILSGDVTILKDVGVFEPHVIAHEFCHRKGYWKELEAQALAYLALSASDDPVLRQSARCERLHRHLRVLARDDLEAFHRRVDESGLRPELRDQFHALRPPPGPYEEMVASVLKPLYEERMKMTGQGGLSDYDEGFTNFLFTAGL